MLKLNHCVYVKYDAPVEKTNPLYLASGCSNQIGHIWVNKNLWFKKFVVQKIFGLKNIGSKKIGQKKFVKKIFGSKIFLGQNIFC